MIVNDAYIFAIIQFIEVDYAKRISVEPIVRIAKIDSYDIHFKKFTYLRVDGTMVNMKNLLRYPSDRFIL